MPMTRHAAPSDNRRVSARRLTPQERAANGRAVRAAVPRSSLGMLELPPQRDPLAILAEQDAGRVPELVPIRYGRMLASPFAFFRGAAAVMARDLVGCAVTGLRTQLCGDAHLLNFGGFGSPERDLVFDLNDFDETLAGSFEWDVKRFAASLEIAGRERGFDRTERKDVVLTGIRAYREAMHGFSSLGDLDVWYARLDAAEMLNVLKLAHDRKLTGKLEQVVQRARRNDGRRALATLTRKDSEQPRFVVEPPLLVPLSELPPATAEEVEASVDEVLARYRASIAPDRRVLLDRFARVDLARKVVGIGSVGTRCWALLCLGRDLDDPLFLQVKEAEQSVLGPGGPANHGRRIVEGQRLLQASSDIFLGWARAPNVDGTPRDFYVRQLRDWKVSLDLDAVVPKAMAYYARACGWTLGRAHARAGDCIAIAAYLGANDRFDRAVAEFASAYADVNEQDHRALRSAVAAGEIIAIEGV
jgi:uncharacterized protein (DUF2252 family)